MSVHSRVNTRLMSVDALRGAAALWVVFYHLWNRYYPHMSTLGRPLSVPQDGGPDFWVTFFLFQFGYTGVSLFFVLSGFCVHLPQARRFAATGEDRLAVKDFFRRRFWRLYPAYGASIVFASLALAFYPCLSWVAGNHPVDLISVMHVRAAIYNALFLQQLSPDTLYFNGVYWTLLLEVQFYVFYPLLLWATRRAGLKRVFWALLGAEVILLFWKIPVKCFFLGRYFEWFLGVLAAEWYASGRCYRPALWTAAAGLAAGVIVVFVPFLWPFRDLLLAAGFLGVLLFALREENHETGKRRMDRSRIFRFFVSVGLFSYSLYLIHIPVIDLVWTGFKLCARIGVTGVNTAKICSLVSVPLALICARGFFHLFEKPFFNKRGGSGKGWPDRKSRKRVAWPAER